MTRKYALLATFSLTALSACSNNNGSVDLGRNVGAALSDYAASWDGYAEAYTFNDNSDRVRLTLDANGQGTLIVGDAPTPTIPDFNDPAVDPGSARVTYLIPGLPYPVDNATVESKRIRLAINLKEPVRQWCEAQTPVCDSLQGCGCLPSWASQCQIGGSCTLTSPDGTQTMTVPFVNFYLCIEYPTCTCTASGCSIGGPTTQLDAALENSGDDLVGTLTVSDGVTVRMARQ